MLNLLEIRKSFEKYIFLFWFHPRGRAVAQLLTTGQPFFISLSHLTHSCQGQLFLIVSTLSTCNKMNPANVKLLLKSYEDKLFSYGKLSQKINRGEKVDMTASRLLELFNEASDDFDKFADEIPPHRASRLASSMFYLEMELKQLVKDFPDPVELSCKSDEDDVTIDRESVDSKDVVIRSIFNCTVNLPGCPKTLSIMGVEQSIINVCAVKTTVTISDCEDTTININSKQIAGAEKQAL